MDRNHWNSSSRIIRIQIRSDRWCEARAYSKSNMSILINFNIFQTASTIKFVVSTTIHKKGKPLTTKAHCVGKNLTNVLNEIFLNILFLVLLSRCSFFLLFIFIQIYYNYKVPRFYVRIKKHDGWEWKKGDRRDSALKHGELNEIASKFFIWESTFYNSKETCKHKR